MIRVLKHYDLNQEDPIENYFKRIIIDYKLIILINFHFYYNHFLVNYKNLIL